jgi:hypothetical protein
MNKTKRFFVILTIAVILIIIILISGYNNLPLFAHKEGANSRTDLWSDASNACIKLSKDANHYGPKTEWCEVMFKNELADYAPPPPPPPPPPPADTDTAVKEELSPPWFDKTFEVLERKYKRSHEGSIDTDITEDDCKKLGDAVRVQVGSKNGGWWPHTVEDDQSFPNGCWSMQLSSAGAPPTIAPTVTYIGWNKNTTDLNNCGKTFKFMSGTNITTCIKKTAATTATTSRRTDKGPCSKTFMYEGVTYTDDCVTSTTSGDVKSWCFLPGPVKVGPLRSWGYCL